VATGLTSAEARRRLAEFGENRIRSEPRTGALTLFVAQFKSPLILILIGAAIMSLFLQKRARHNICAAKCKQRLVGFEVDPEILTNERHFRHGECS
jgi:magnesium-transporting ATPase (P-type)